MKKETLLLLSGLGLSVGCFSQQLSPSVVASGGDISRSATISLEWTLGEFAVESVNSDRSLYTQGFHQPYLQVKEIHTATIATETPDYKITIAPNPVQSVLNVNLQQFIDEKLSLTLVDLYGRRVMTKVVEGKSTSSLIDMSGMMQGIYLLEIRNAKGQLLKVFRVVKVQ